MRQGYVRRQEPDLFDLGRTFHQQVPIGSGVEFCQVFFEYSATLEPLAEAVDRVRVVRNPGDERLDVVLVPGFPQLLQQDPDFLLVSGS
jgi:hypothetical protein